MKISITGHTSGLGKALYDFWSTDHCVTGYSRSNGYNINSSLDKICEDVEFDIFVNNAYSGYQQVNLLYNLYKKNKDRNCVILNIGSGSSDGNVDRIKPYAIEKLALERACLQLQFNSIKCKVILIKPGRMETEMVKHVNGEKLNPDYVVSCINWIISQPSNVIIRSISLDSF